MNNTMTRSQTVRLIYLAAAGILALMFFLPTFCVGLFGADLLSFSSFTLVSGVDLMGYQEGGSPFFLLFLFLPLAEAVLALPKVRPGMFLTPVVWLVFFCTLVGSMAPVIHFTGLGKLYFLLMLLQIPLFVLYTVFAVKEARAESQTGTETEHAVSRY